MSSPDTPPRRRLVVSLDDEPSAGATAAPAPPSPSTPPLPPVPPPRPPLSVNPVPPATASPGWAPPQPPHAPPPPRSAPAATPQGAPAAGVFAAPGMGSGLPLASRGARLLSRFLEAMILTPPLLFLYAIVAGFAYAGVGALGLVVLVVGLLAGLVITTVHPTRPGEHNGQTIARRILGLRLVHVDRTPIGVETMVKRRFLFPLLLIIPFGLGIVADRFWPLFDARKRRLVDVLCRTEVVVAEGTAPGVASTPPPPYR